MVDLKADIFFTEGFPCIFVIEFSLEKNILIKLIGLLWFPIAFKALYLTLVGLLEVMVSQFDLTLIFQQFIAVEYTIELSNHQFIMLKQLIFHD